MNVLLAEPHLRGVSLRRGRRRRRDEVRCRICGYAYPMHSYRCPRSNVQHE